MAITQTVEFDSTPTNTQVGDLWFSGTSETARELHRENLTLDMTLTSITLNCTAATGVSGSNPGIVRVYQEGHSSSAALLEIAGTGVATQAINLDILSSRGANRTLIIDAFDPDGSSPNNSCSITGTISVAGRPNISSVGASTTGP